MKIVRLGLLVIMVMVLGACSPSTEPYDDTPVKQDIEVIYNYTEEVGIDIANMQEEIKDLQEEIEYLEGVCGVEE